MNVNILTEKEGEKVILSFSLRPYHTYLIDNCVFWTGCITSPVHNYCGCRTSWIWWYVFYFCLFLSTWSVSCLHLISSERKSGTVEDIYLIDSRMVEHEMTKWSFNRNPLYFFLNIVYYMIAYHIIDNVFFPFFSFIMMMWLFKIIDNIFSFFKKIFNSDTVARITLIYL